MKKLLISFLALICSAMLFYSSILDKKTSTLLIADVESLAQGEGDGGIVIICRCSATPYVGNRRCKVTNEGNICAYNEDGGNVLCDKYNANC